MEQGGNLFTERFETVSFISQNKWKMQNDSKRGDAMQVENEIEKNQLFFHMLKSCIIDKSERKHVD